MIPGIGDKTAKQLISYTGSAEQLFKTPKGKLKKIPDIGEKTAEAIVSSNRDILYKEAEERIEKAKKLKSNILFYTDPEYPSRLKQIPDAPVLLYVKGAMNLEANRILAIVGTRNASEYGKQLVKDLIEGLREYSPLIVSGLAYGIDIAAHKEALSNNIPTVGVLGSGIDQIYPALHKPVAEKMMENNGGLITEYTYGTKPEAQHFPERNRIVAGLCDGIVVIEAAEKGGALITAEIANSYNREVMALPGNVNATYSQGSNNLIKTHKAALITNATDIAELLNWDITTNQTRKTKKERPVPENLTEAEKIVYDHLLTVTSIQIDELSWKTQIEISQLASALLSLEFQGLIKSLPGKKYQLI